MAVVPGAKRKRKTDWRKQFAKTRKSMAKASAAVRERTTHQQCNRCSPPRMVPLKGWSIHRDNFHKPGGYEYELRKLRQEQAKSRQQKPTPPPRPPRPPRPKNQTKTQPNRPTPFKRENPVGQNNGTAPAPSPQAVATAPEGIAEAYRLWAMLVPPSIPAARMDAQAMAEAYRQMADAIRLRLRMEMEQNNLPEAVLEPYQQAANLVSQIGDLHMEVVRRVEVRYAEVADMLARPDTPNAEYLKGGR